jgi:CHASE2 domain-containing sensor protein/signal transduction histidine kinase
MMNQRRLVLEWLALLIFAVLVAGFAAQDGLTRRLDLAMLDLAATLGQPPPAPDIAIVAIDERSLAEIGEWPWRRATHAQLVDNLRAGGARVVLYDVLLVEPGKAEDDAALASAIARNGKVVLPFSFGPQMNTAGGIAPEYPLPALASAAAAMGHIELAPDEDGAVRRFALTRRIGDRAYPHFVPAALSLGGSEAISGATAPDAPELVVPFRPALSYPHIPAAAVIKGTVPRALLEGRTIVVGATARGMGDIHAVPSGAIGLMSGAEMQANLIDGLRTGTLIREMPATWAAALAAVTLLIQFLGFWKLPARAEFLLTLALIAGIAATSALLVPLARVWIAPGAALLAAGLAYPLWSWRRLTVVSGYLDHETQRLMSATGDMTLGRGAGSIARQVDRMRQLVGEVSDALSLVRSAIAASPDAILVLDADNAVILANEAAHRLFDETPDPIGHSLPDLYINQNLAVDRDNAEIALRDGRVFLFAAAPLAGKLKEGRASRIIAFRDITDLRRRQRENDELIEFLSHDMRSPQVAIMALTRELGVKDANLARRIRAQAQLTLGLADGFVQLARVAETGATCRNHDLASVLHEAIDQAHATAARKSIAVQRIIPEEPLFADIDPALIARMAANLIGNAVRYTQNGGTVTVTLALSGAQEVQIIVADNGPGLPDERMQAPFTRYGVRSGPEDGPSAGLGLAFVKRVVDAHRGTIEVRANPGRGTLFDVRLPITQPD